MGGQNAVMEWSTTPTEAHGTFCRTTLSNTIVSWLYALCFVIPDIVCYFWVEAGCEIGVEGEMRACRGVGEAAPCHVLGNAQCECEWLSRIQGLEDGTIMQVDTFVGKIFPSAQDWAPFADARPLCSPPNPTSDAAPFLLASCRPALHNSSAPGPATVASRSCAWPMERPSRRRRWS